MLIAAMTHENQVLLYLSIDTWVNRNNENPKGSLYVLDLLVLIRVIRLVKPNS
jgi:hypothetical protein